MGKSSDLPTKCVKIEKKLYFELYRGYMNKFAERLKEVLKIKGISQNKFSKIINVPQQTLNRWCNGNYEPSFDMLITICKELEESADYMIGLED